VTKIRTLQRACIANIQGDQSPDTQKLLSTASADLSALIVRVNRFAKLDWSLGVTTLVTRYLAVLEREEELIAKIAYRDSKLQGFDDQVVFDELKPFLEKIEVRMP
jgi:hypothetical protein